MKTPTCFPALGARSVLGRNASGPAVLVAALAMALFLTACHRGSRYDSQGDLRGLSFLDPQGVNPEDPSEAPAAAPLVQQILFTFNARPNPAQVGPDTLPVLDEAGMAVSGRYDVRGDQVTFTPALPTRAPAPQEGGGLDGGGAGLSPGRQYTVRVSGELFPFVASIDPALLERFEDPDQPGALRVDFSTTELPADFYRGLPPREARLLSTSPADGAVGVSPQLFTDPDGLFPPSEGFSLRYDTPLNPAEQNLAGFGLVDLDAGAGPAGLELGSFVQLISNELEGATVLLRPSGILALGHLHLLEAPVGIDALHEDLPDMLGTLVAASFTTADTEADPIRDLLVEDFEDASTGVPDGEIVASGSVPAEWDRADSNLLQAARPFTGDGRLGRFIPSPRPDSSEPRRVVLDTDQQGFPLIDGSTPDVAPGTQVQGGVFEFTDIDIPEGVVLSPRGSQPLVLRATGSVRIAGTIELSGGDGVGESAFDSAVQSIPGGTGVAGGGRGGEGHPLLYFPPDQAGEWAALVSPPAGGQGWGTANREARGGRGGQSGMLDRGNGQGRYSTDQEISCSEFSSSHNNGYNVPGGGGGSLLQSGGAPLTHGIGNVLPDGQGGYLVRTPGEFEHFRRLLGGAPGDALFGDADSANDFIGPTGEVQTVVAGQGGGGGASATDSYYCGTWCRYDTDPSNDAVCGAEFGDPPVFAGSVGDARGAGGGAGGGALVIDALGSIILTGTAVIEAAGGAGGGGEALFCGNWSGCGAGGSGGAVLLQSGEGIVVRSMARIEVPGGLGRFATPRTDYLVNCFDLQEDAPGSGGQGGHGIIQLRVPRGEVAVVEDPGGLTPGAWVDADNLLNPARLDGKSRAISRWFDLGRTIARGPPGTAPRFRFGGLDSGGRVVTDAEGNVLDPEATDVHCFWPGVIDEGYGDGRFVIGEEPRDHWVPPNATVSLAFQGAEAITEGSREVDPASLSEWAATPAVADGMQFLRIRVTFTLEGGPSGDSLAVDSRRPGVQSVQVPTEF